MDIRGKLEELLRIEAAITPLNERKDQLRDELEQEARRAYSEQGVVPTWKAELLGTATLATRDAGPVITDARKFLNWVIANHPTEITHRVRFLFENPNDAEREIIKVLYLKASEIPTCAIEETQDYSAAFLKAIAKNYSQLRDPEAGDEAQAQLVTPEGEVVPGVAVPAPKRYLSVRLDREAKARARADLIDHDALRAGLVEPCPVCDAVGADKDGQICDECLGRGVLLTTAGNALASGTESAYDPNEEPDAAEGEPEFEEAGQ